METATQLSKTDHLAIRIVAFHAAIVSATLWIGEQRNDRDTCVAQ